LKVDARELESVLTKISGSPAHMGENHMAWRTTTGIVNEKGRLDRVNLGLAALLFISPWLLNFSGLAIAANLAWISAIVIGVLSLAAIIHFAEWEEAIILAVGVFLVVAPYWLNFAYLNSAAAAFVGIGAFVIAISFSDLWISRRPQRRNDRPLSS
jgi:hypothetical protein